MNKCNFTKIFLGVSICLLFVTGEILAQGFLWDEPYANEWLDGKYSQKWLRIGISTKGIHKVTLPPGFMNGANPNTLRLYHRGIEVALTSASGTEIEFYGVPNDGTLDALLYRPYSSRINPYYSMFSDESAYFLTIGAAGGKRAVVENISDATGADLLGYHLQTDNVNYQNEYSHATQFPTRPTNLNSFMEDGQTRTGLRLVDDSPHPVFSTFPILIKNKFGSDAPTIDALVHGRSNYKPNGLNTRNVHIYIGKDAGTLRDVTQVPIDGFKPGSFSFEVQPNDLNAGAGTLGFSIDSPFQGVAFDRFSVTYYNVNYKQLIDMQGLSTYNFTFPGASQGSKSKIVVTTPPAAGTLKFYDISDPKNPRVITGTAASVLFTRPTSSTLKMLATTVTNDVAPGKVTTVTFTDFNRSNYDYLIISNTTLLNAAQAFETYRKTQSPGKKYKTGVFNIVDLYNQFNYGEPSPLAIRRFVDYMVSDGNKERYLLLMGKSVTRNDRITKELPDEVPTFGFPGSDLLLVEGLQGTDRDVPSIPFGRIPAATNAQAIAYLDKVKSYEATTSGLSWRRNVVHISGGKTDSEIDDHGLNLSTAAVKVKAAPFNGKVYSALKPVATDAVIQNDTLFNQVNFPAPSAGKPGGVGMITYFGHSVPYQTDYNFGYVSDPAKQFSNPGKYPIMFYNGCDILNVFSNNFAETVNTSTSRPQSLDWLLSANKGAVAVFGNSWAGYATSCNNYMQKVYTEMFGKNDQTRQTLGKILQLVAQQTKSAPGSGFRMGPENARTSEVYIQDQAQLHQTIILGDPALQILLSTEGGLPVDLISFDAKVSGPAQVNVSWKTSSEVNNSHFIVERSYNAKNFEEVGRVEGKGNTEMDANYNFIDNKPLAGTSYYRLKQVDFSVKDENGIETDGKSTLSKVVSVKREGTKLLTIYPNPIAETANIILDAPVGLKTWSVLDGNGVVRKSGKGIKADLSNLTSGNYIIKIVTDNNDVYYHKIVKR
jgi:hypothetical protein